MTLRDLLYKTDTGVKVKVIDINTNEVLVDAISGYILNRYEILPREIVTTSVEDSIIVVIVR